MFEIFTKHPPSVKSSIVATVLGLISIVAGLVVFAINKSADPISVGSLILGFVLFYAGSVFTTFFQQIEIASAVADQQEQQEKRHEDALHLSSELHNRTAEALGLYQEFLSETWCRDVLRDLADVLRSTNGCTFQRDVVRRMIEEHVSDIKKGWRKPYTDKFTYEEEWKRRQELKELVANAQKYAFAVTIDGGDYITRFWSTDDHFVSDYLLAGACRKERVFVLGPDFYDGSNTDKIQTISRTIRRHVEFGIQYWLVPRAKLSTYLRDHDTSFLVCDDIVISESYSLSDDGKKSKGHVTINDVDRAKKLTGLFNELKVFHENPPFSLTDNSHESQVHGSDRDCPAA